MPSADPGEMSDFVWDRHQAIIAGFEAAWRRRERPKIGDHLPDEIVRRDELLVELVHADLEFRIKSGERARVEDYLEEYPSLGRGRETVLGLIRAECSIRRRKEPGLKLARYRRRFPELRAELQGPNAEASTAQAPADSAKAVAPDPSTDAGLPLPRRLGKFELKRKLGVGSFGVVYQAWDTVLGREVAVKVPRPEVAAAQCELGAFLREARNAIDLRHPNIVAILDAGPVGGTQCLVRAYIEGVTLAERLREGPFTPRETTALLGIVADAVDHAHRGGIIHRDLKPSNILLDLRGQPHVSDFGLAKRESGDTTLSPAGTPGLMIGTPAYMAPEQARGETYLVDARSDVYSLGVILYELLTGSVPFRGRGRMLEIQIQEVEPTPPRSLNDEVPADLETICLKALAKDPLGRYPSSKAMADDLRNFLEGRPVGATKPEPGGRSAGRPWWKSWRRGWAPAVGSVLALALGSTTALWLRADARRARDAEGLERVFRTLLDAASPRVAEDSRRARPGPDRLGRAWDLVEGLDSALDGDPALLEVAADARLGLAERATAEGSDEAAAPAWERAVRACEASLEGRPGVPSRLADLAGALTRLAEIRRREGRPAESRGLFDRALRLRSVVASDLKRRASGRLDDFEGQIGRAEASLRLAEAKAVIVEPSEVPEVESIARTLLETPRPGLPAADRRRAGLLLDVSRWQLAEGRARWADESALKAYRVYRDLGPGTGSGPELARACLALARANLSLRREAEATGWCSEAVGRFEELVGLDPGRADWRRGLGDALFEAGRALDRPGHRPGAIEHYRRSLQVRLGLDRDHPGAHATLADLGKVRLALALAFEAEGRTALALANRLMAGRDLARASALAPGEPAYRPPPDELPRDLARIIRAGRAR